ncbi:MAG: STAS/SEC14 domain-containing protein [Syntrophales bacterium]
MIDYTLDRDAAIVHVRPMGPLARGDFDRLAGEVDPFIEKTGDLAGLIIEIKKFPGWENLGGALRHFRFVRDHHKKIKKVAVVTDSPIGTVAEHIASHFVSAEIKHFDADKMEAAKLWITGGD